MSEDQDTRTTSTARTIRIIAPSYSMATIPAERRALGVARLSELGFGVEFGAHVEEVVLHRVGSVEHRLADLMPAVDDPEVDIVMAAQGGTSSNQLLPLIDYDRVARSGTQFVGFSDISALLLALGRYADASVVHGPTFGELCNPILPDYTVKGLLGCLAGRRVDYRSPAATSDELWSCESRSEPSAHFLFDGWKVIRGGRGSGPLVGGNLLTIGALGGTRYFPETQGRILFLEDAVGEGAGAIHRVLTQCAQLGAFDDLAAFMFGQVPRGVALNRPGMLRAILDDVLPDGARYPVVVGVSCSHLSPMISLPLFRPAHLDLEGEPRLVVNCDVSGELVEVEGKDALTQSA